MTTTKQWPSQGIINVVPTSYQIPTSGNMNWPSLTDFLVNLANGAQSTTFQRFANRTAIATPVNVTVNDCIVCTNLTVPGPVMVNLPAGVDKQILIISDNKGDGQFNPITITPNASETIGGVADLVLNTNYEAVILAFQASSNNWNIVAKGVPNPNGGSVGGFTPDRAVVSDANGILTASVTSSAELGFLDGLTSSIQPQLDGKQPLDADLTSITGLSGTGFATRTAADTWETRTLMAGSSKVSMTDGDGVAGDPVIDVVEANLTLDNVGGTLGIPKGGTGVTAVTTAPTASAFTAWDANQNISANAFIPKYTTTATSGGTTVLDVGSTHQQFFTGTSLHTIILPVVSSLVEGQSYHIVNKSTQNVTVQSSGANTVQVMGTGSYAVFTCILTSGTSETSWNTEYSTSAAGTVTSVAMTVPAFLSVSGSPVTTNGTLAVGVTAGNSGGILGYTGSTTLASSAALTANQLIVGGGAGATPSTLAAGTTGQYLRLNSSPIPAWYTVPKPSIQKFTSSSGTYIPSFTFFVSSANATVGATYTNNAFTFTVSQTIASGLLLVCVGTGSPAASGTLTKSTGTGDATITFSSFVQPVSLQVLMIGGGGGGGGGGNSAGSAGGTGNAGGNTTFGTTFLVANGGPGGGWNAQPVAGGTASIAAGALGIATTGASGTAGNQGIGGTIPLTGGYGAASPFGGAGGGGYSNVGLAAATSTGAGGGGAGCGTGGGANNISGGGGCAGGYVNAIVTPVSASYPYAVGAGNAGGTAGGSAGFVGGAGGSGQIIVFEHYI